MPRASRGKGQHVGGKMSQWLGQEFGTLQTWVQILALHQPFSMALTKSVMIKSTKDLEELTSNFRQVRNTQRY